jgi:hypothetical protein
VQQQHAVLARLFQCESQPARLAPLLLWQPSLLLAEQQQQASQEAWQQQQQPGGVQTVDSLAGVQQRVTQLAASLQLPGSLILQAVLDVPDVLALSQPATAAVLTALASSWLADAEALRARQQYRGQLLQALKPPQSNGRQGRKGRGSRQAAAQQQSLLQHTPSLDWFAAAELQERAAVGCQWWEQQQQDLPAVQQLMLQAPGLLVLQARSGSDGLDARLLQLASHLQQQAVDQLHHQQDQGQWLSQVQRLAVLEPRALSHPPGFVGAQLQQLARSLQLPLAEAWALVQGCPGLLWLTQAQLFQRIRVLCGVLGVPARSIGRQTVVCNSPWLLLLPPRVLKQQGGMLLVA